MSDQSPRQDHSRGDALALQIFATLRSRSESDRRLVLDALAARLDVPHAGQAVLDLQRCAREIARVPSRRAFDQWRESLPSGVTALSSSAIRKALGNSWITALDRAGLAPLADVTVRRLTAMGGFYTRDEVEAALLACAKELGRCPKQAEYVAWARARREETGARLPTSAPTFIRTHGSWHGLCEVVGFVLEDEPRTLSREDAKRALQCASSATGKRLLPAIQYDAWRRNADLGTSPSSRVIKRLFQGSWPKALEAAGLLRDYEAEYFQNHPGVWISDDRILDDLADAMRQYGGSLTVYRYTYSYRDTARRERGRAPVTSATIISRFGTWEDAKDAASMEHPELRHED